MSSLTTDTINTPSQVDHTMEGGRKTRQGQMNDTEQGPEKVDRGIYCDELQLFVDDARGLEERYRAEKLLRDTGAIPEDMAQYLILNTLGCIADNVSRMSANTPGTILCRTFTGICRQEDMLEEQGCNGDIVQDPEWEAYTRAYEAERHRIEAAVCRAFNEHDLAELIERDGVKRIFAISDRYFLK